MSATKSDSKLLHERYERDLLSYGCGYWSVCVDHACPCSSDAAVSKGFSATVWASLKAEAESEAKMAEDDWIPDEDSDYPDDDCFFEDDFDATDSYANSELLSREQLHILGITSEYPKRIERSSFHVKTTYVLPESAVAELHKLGAETLAGSIAERLLGYPLPGYGLFNVHFDSATNELSFTQFDSCD